MKIDSDQLIPLNKPSEVRQESPDDVQDVKTLRFFSRTGTHLLLPYHHAYQGYDCQQFPISLLIGEAAVFDVSAAAGHGSVTRECIKGSEDQLREQDMVILFSGGSDPGADVDLTFELFQWLLSRRPKLIGVDAPELTVSGKADLLYAICSCNNIPVALNLTNLQPISGTRPTIFALPIPLQGAEACMCGVIAVTDRPR